MRLLKGFVFFLLLVLVGGASGYLAMRLSQERGEVAVPELSGQDIVFALEVLNQRDLNLQISSQEFSSAVPKNHILSQSPTAGSRVRRGRRISVVLSRGARMVDVPEVRGETWGRAERLIQGEGLRVGWVSRVHSPIFPRHVVVAQSPPPQRLIERGHSVNILVSLGRPKSSYLMPDVIGRDLESVMAMVRRLDFRVGQVKYEIYPGVRSGVVIGQEPKAGYLVTSGDKVNLVVAQSEAATAKGGTFSLLYYKVPVGTGKRRVRIVLQEGGQLQEIYNRLEEPGADVAVMVRAEGKSRARIYLDGQLVEERVY